MLAGRGGDGLDVDGLDPAAVVDQLLDRQAVDREAGQRAGDRAGRLEPEREDADQEVARGARARDASTVVSRIRSSSASVSMTAGTVTSVLTAARALNGPAPRRMSNPALAP